MLAWSSPAARAQLLRQTADLSKLPLNSTQTAYALEPALGSLRFQQPLALATPPGETNRLFVVEQSGTIQVVPLNTLTKRTFLDIRDVPEVGRNPTNLVAEGEAGLLGLAFHPAYATNRTFFVYYSVKVGGKLHQRVARIQSSTTDADVADPATHVALITQPDFAYNHNGGDMHFGPDGYLYVALGDGGGADDYLDHARWLDRDFHAGLLRIDVDRQRVGEAGGGREPNPHPAIDLDPSTRRARYAIPPDNPLLAPGIAGTRGPLGTGSYPAGGNLDATKLRTEFYAFGLRNPWRFSFDRPTGRLFLGDVGQEKREEINLVTRGANLGWPYREGSIIGPTHRQPAPLDPPARRVEPIHDYPRDIGSSITGGIVYRGTRLPGLSGDYLFADFYRGIFALRENAGVWQRRALTSRTPYTAGIGVDPRDGDALFADLINGVVRRLVPNGTTGSPPPATLSETGLFADLGTLEPALGIVPYEVNHPFWSDHARKRRWFALPAAPATIGFAADAPWNFPSGMVWVKHFDLEATRGDPTTARRIETRVLVRNADGVHGFTYRWREDQSDAELVPAAGEDVDYTTNVEGIDRAQRWRFPSHTECLSCHTPEAGHALGFNTRQLNRRVRHDNLEDNQLNHLGSAGYFSVGSKPQAAAVVNLPAHAAIDDTSQSLEHRLRSYLAVNCISCHGPGSPSGEFDVSATLTTEATNLRTAAAIRSDGHVFNRLLVPGDESGSHLLKRIRGDGVPRMPPLATQEPDSDAENLLRAYIAELIDSPTSSEWQKRHFGGGDSKQEAETDPDGDDAPNRLEYLAHTSPTTPGPDPLAFSVTPDGSETVLRFLHPAGRAAIIETSPDGVAWTRWSSPEGDTTGYPALPVDREITIATPHKPTHVRVRLLER